MEARIGVGAERRRVRHASFERWRSSGFTLLELLVVLAIAAVLLGAGVPSFLDDLADRRLDRVQRDLAWDLRRARTESAARNAPLIVCASSTGSVCTDDWSDGWIIFADAATGMAGERDAQDALLTSRPASTTDSVRIAAQRRGRWSSVSETTNGVRFQGRVRGSTAFFVLCDERGIDRARGILISAAGEVGTQPGLDDGVMLDAWGARATCPA